MEEIFSVLFFVGMLLISVVAQKKKGSPKAAAPSVPSPDFFPPEESETAPSAPEVPPAPFRQAAPQAATSRKATASSPLRPASTSSGQVPVSETDASPSAEAVRQGIIWSEILHRKYC